MIAILMFTALAAASPPASPSPPEQPTPKADTVVVAKDVTTAKFDDMICRQIQITGSRLGSQRVCLTRAKWDDIGYGGRKWVEGDQGFRIPPPQ